MAATLCISGFYCFPWVESGPTRPTPRTSFVSSYLTFIFDSKESIVRLVPVSAGSMAHYPDIEVCPPKRYRERDHRSKTAQATPLGAGIRHPTPLGAEVRPHDFGRGPLTPSLVRTAATLPSGGIKTRGAVRRRAGARSARVIPSSTTDVDRFSARYGEYSIM